MPSMAQPRTLAVFTKNRVNPAYAAARLAADRVAAEVGARTVHYVPETPDDVGQQKMLVGEALANRPDAVVFVPTDDGAMVEDVRRFEAAGIPVVNCINRMEGRFVSFVGSDDVAVGYTAARALIDGLGSKGDIVVIDDHINLTGHNPLIGPNEDRFGTRFPDMSQVYSSRLRKIADQAGHTLDIPLPHGVYAGVSGPSYETPAEIRYLRTIGADAVGMSTVPEAIAARHMKMDVLGISCITNMAAGVLPQPLDHAEVMETARRIRGQFIALLEAIIGQV